MQVLLRNVLLKADIQRLCYDQHFPFSTEQGSTKVKEKNMDGGEAAHPSWEAERSGEIIFVILIDLPFYCHKIES